MTDQAKWDQEATEKRVERRWFDVQAEALDEAGEMLVGEGHPEAAELLRQRADRLRNPKAVVSVLRDAGMG